MSLDLPCTDDEHRSEVAALRARVAELEAERAADSLDHSIMHEVSNLVTLLTLGLPELADTVQGGSARQVQDRIDLLGDVTESLTELLWVRTVVRPATRAVRSTSADLHRVVPAVLHLLRQSARGVAVIAEEIEAVPDVTLPPGTVVRVLLNLVNNSVDALRESGRNDGVITVRLTSTVDFVRLDVVDNGAGIPSRHLERIFDPGFSTKGDRGGLGVGLSVCRAIMSSVGGFIRASSRGGRGTTMSLLLPVAS